MDAGTGRGRTAGHPAAPAQIPAGEIIAPGSCLPSAALHAPQEHRDLRLSRDEQGSGDEPALPMVLRGG